MFASIYSLQPQELYQKALVFEEVKDYDNYIIHMTMAANLDHSLAKEYLYNDYRHDHIHNKQNYNKTINFYESTIEYGFSANYMAWMFDKGLGVGQDYNKAIELYKMAIDKGNCAAMNNLAIIYDKGIAVPEDHDEAIKLYKMAIEKGNSTAMNNLGLYYKTKVKDYDLMKKYYLMGIDKGNINIMNNFGYYYHFEEKDYELMKKYYLMAIDKGDSIAMQNLGHYYDNIEKNYDQMKKYYLMAIDKGNLSAMNNLGYYYHFVEKNYELMKKYYLMAMEEGNLSVITNLQHYYENHQNDLSVINLYDNKNFHDSAKDIINRMFQDNRNLPEQYKHQFANLIFDDDIHVIVKIKQNILKKTNIWPSNYDSNFLKEYNELLLISSSNTKCFCKDIILHIAGSLFI